MKVPASAPVVVLAALVATIALTGAPAASGDIPATSTTVSCAPGSIMVYQVTTCTATVTGGSESFSGVFLWSASVSGSFSTTSPGPYPDTCVVTSVAPITSPAGYCSVTFIPLAPAASGSVTLTAIYEYDEDHGSSTGTTQLTVTPGTTLPSTVTVVTATVVETVTTVSTSTVTTGPSISVLGASALVVVAAVLIVLTFLAGEWRRAAHPKGKAPP